jgi:hypothetical protein
MCQAAAGSIRRQVRNNASFNLWFCLLLFILGCERTEEPIPNAIYADACPFVRLITDLVPGFSRQGSRADGAAGAAAVPLYLQGAISSYTANKFWVARFHSDRYRPITQSFIALQGDAHANRGSVLP